MQNSEANILSPEKWVNKYGDYLYGYAMSKLFNKELAEDLLQETFLAAFKGKENFKGKSNEKTWLISILKRKIFDYYRKKAKNIEQTQNYDSPFIEDKFMHGQWKQERAPKQWDITDADLSSDEGFLNVLKKCISFLPDKWKSVFSLKHIEGVSTNEICDELDVSESNIWVILHRSRLKLRECIEKLWFK